MAKNNKQNKKVQSGGFGKSCLGNFVISILVLFFIISIYSLIVGNKSKEEISISELAGAVKTGEIKEISVKNGIVEAIFKDDVVKTSKKEESSNITDPLAAYGVTPADISKIKISVT